MKIYVMCVVKVMKVLIEKFRNFVTFIFLFQILSAAYASSNTFIPLQNTFQILKKNPAVILKANNLQSIDFKQ